MSSSSSSSSSRLKDRHTVRSGYKFRFSGMRDATACHESVDVGSNVRLGLTIVYHVLDGQTNHLHYLRVRVTVRAIATFSIVEGLGCL